MKKILIIFLIVVNVVSYAFADIWNSKLMNHKDDFGDVVEEYYNYECVGIGSLSFNKTKEVPILWELIIIDSKKAPMVVFTILENSKNVNLSTAKKANEPYKLLIKGDDGTIENHEGVIIPMYDGVYSSVVFNIDFKKYFLKNNNIRLIISNDSGSYSLGNIVSEGFIDQYLITLGMQRGPAGGIVFYDKGYYSDGWRYLEAAPADLKVVNGVPTVDSSLEGYANEKAKYPFGHYRLTNYGEDLYVNGSTIYNASDCTGTAIGTGKSNTEKLVNSMGTNAYTYSDDKGYYSTDNYAARLCDRLEYTADGITYDDWFLPSLGELEAMINKFCPNGVGGIWGEYNWLNSYWSSSELSSDSSWATYFNGFWDSYQNTSRHDDNNIRPIRAF